MKRKKWIAVLITFGLFSALPNRASATLLDSSFMGDYFRDNQQPKIVFDLPNEDFEFAMKEPSINVSNQMVSYNNNKIPLCFEYQDIRDNPFLPRDLLILDSESIMKPNFQFDSTSDSLFPQFSPGERIKLRFPVNSFYEGGGGIAYSTGPTSLAGIPGSTTLALLGMGVFVFFSVIGGAEIADFLRK